MLFSSFSLENSMLKLVFVLFLQALACYFPHFLWKSWEGGKLKLLLQDLGGQSLDTERETTNTRRHVIVNYIIRNIRTHNVYVYKFIFCEFLNLVNIIVQLYLMDAFFQRSFYHIWLRSFDLFKYGT